MNVDNFDELERLLTELANRRIHVRDAERILQHFREIVFTAFNENKIDAHTLHAKLTNIKRIEDRIHEEFHDFTINNKTITLPREQHLYTTQFP